MKRTATLALVASLSLAPLTGCENLPGGKKEQGTVIGGAGGALAGAAVAGENNRLLGALIGGALGAGGGYLIGAKMEKTDPKNRDEAVKASQTAEANPAKPEDVRKSTTADLNSDGYVTLDEVTAMQRAGLNDSEMVNRLRATGQIFELTAEQENYLRTNGVAEDVIAQLRTLNQPTANTGNAQRAGDTIGNQPISSPPR